MKNKTIKEISFCILISLIFISLFGFFLNIDVFASSNLDDKKIYCKIDNRDFDTSSVLVVMKKEVSAKKRKYSADYFKGVPINAVYDISRIESKDYFDCKNDYRQILQIKLSSKSKEDVITAIKKIEKIDDVFWVGPNYYEKMMKQPVSAATPNSGIHRYPLLWGLNENAGINIEKAWDITTGTSNVRVGVIDSGMFSHLDTSTNIADEGGDFVNMHDLDENIPGPLRYDYALHGSPISSIIGATGLNANGVTGIAWNIKMIPLQVSVYDEALSMWVFDESAIIRALTWSARNNVDIINYSGGIDVENIAVKSAIENFNGLFIAAAGNGGTDEIGDDNDIHRMFPADYSSGQTFSDRVIAVGAYRKVSNGNQISVNKCSFSNFGENKVTIFAPGENILCAIPSESCEYSDIVFNDGTRLCEFSNSNINMLINIRNNYEFTWQYIIDNFNDLFQHQPSYYAVTSHQAYENHYSNFEGTSYAAPYVTGVATLIWDILKSTTNLTRQQLASAIKSSIIAGAKTNDSGNPFENLCEADGRLDAYSSIKYALSHYVSSSVNLNNYYVTTTYNKTISGGDTYFNNKNAFYKLNVTSARTYTINVTSNYSFDALLYDSDFNEMTYSSSNIANGKQISIYLNSGTYYLRNKYINEDQSGMISTQIVGTHTHSYNDHYIWKNNKNHKSYCVCSNYKTQPHAVSPDAYQSGNMYATCLFCGGDALIGIIHSKGNNDITYITKNGSFILPNGVIVLADEDIDAYLNGTLFNEKKIIIEYYKNISEYYFEDKKRIDI